MDGDIIWAPAIDGALVLSTRDGDWAPTCRSETCRTTPEPVQLYLEETLTFLCYTAEASVALTP